MTRNLFMSYLFLAGLWLSPAYVLAGTPTSDRIAIEAAVKNEISLDLAQKYEPLKVLADRKCLDGRAVKDFQGEIVEYWANLECAFCGILEPVKAQRDNPDICIVVRHIPSAQYGESLKKALAFEALRSFSINAANRFWDAVVPKALWVCHYRMKPPCIRPLRKRRLTVRLLARLLKSQLPLWR